MAFKEACWFSSSDIITKNPWHLVFCLLTLPPMGSALLSDSRWQIHPTHMQQIYSYDKVAASISGPTSLSQITYGKENSISNSTYPAPGIFHCPKISHLTVFCHIRLPATPCTTAHQAPLSMELSRQEYWSGLPFPPRSDLPDPGFKTVTLASARRFFTVSATWD